MNSLILRNVTRFMLPLLLLFSLFLFVRGHQRPGGGFSAGLVATAAFTLYAMAFGVSELRRIAWFGPQWLIGVGLLVSLASGIVGLAQGYPLLTHQYAWVELTLPSVGKFWLGTPLAFDLGVYLVVLGVTLTMILNLAEE